MKIFSFLGLPGAGKTTLAQLCFKRLGVKYLSTGDLCRKHIAIQTDFGKIIENAIKHGRLIPDFLIASLVEDWFANINLLKSGIILDGYPRSLGQIEFFCEKFSDFISKGDFFVIYFIISHDKALKQIRDRHSCENKNCQMVYACDSAAVRRGCCDYCGIRLVKREDDNIDMVLDRLKKYSDYIQKLLDCYKKKAIPVISLDINQLNYEEIFNIFKKTILDEKKV